MGGAAMRTSSITQDQSQPQETLQSLSPDDSGIVTPQPANNDQILHAPGMQHNEESLSPQPTPDTETQDDAPTLPSYQPLASPNFVWGTYDSETTKKTTLAERIARLCTGGEIYSQYQREMLGPLSYLS